MQAVLSRIFLELTFSLRIILQPHTIRIGHLGNSSDASWYVDEVIVDIPARNEHYLYACQSWLAEDRGDGKTEVELYGGTGRF